MISAYHYWHDLLTAVLRFTAAVPAPSRLALGEHTLRVEAVCKNGQSESANMVNKASCRA